MNIFYLSNDIKECAKWHMDKHVVKMILEYGQILTTSHRILDNIDENHSLNNILYKKTHIKHPCVLWTMICEENYNWLYNLLYELIQIYKIRYNRTEHKTERLLNYLKVPPLNINRTIKFFHPPLAMKEESKIFSCHIECYRYCYQTEKKHLGWKDINNIPYWYNITKK